MTEPREITVLGSTGSIGRQAIAVARQNPGRLQVTGLAALVGIPIAAGLVTVPGADVAGIAITAVALAVAAIGIRHAMRHSRLSVRVVAPLKRAPRSLTRAG